MPAPLDPRLASLHLDSVSTPVPASTRRPSRPLARVTQAERRISAVTPAIALSARVMHEPARAEGRIS